MVIGRIVSTSVVGIVSGLLLVTPVVVADELLESFVTPPQSARPQTWWHWMNGNITAEGIEKDLEWMSSIGLGGVQNFNVSLNTPRIVEEPLDFMTPEWKKAFRFAVMSASEKNMDFAIAASPGWSETGGPWVKPEDGMKKLVWSEITVAGGKTFDGKLPALPSETGPFQDIAFHDPLAMGKHDNRLPVYAADETVLAFPSSDETLIVPDAVDQDGNPVPVANLIDEALSTVASLPIGEGSGVPTIVYRYDHPVAVRSATLFIPAAKPPFREPLYLPALEVKEGDSWRKLGDLPLAEVPTTISFRETVAQDFRLRFVKNNTPPDELAAAAAPGTPSFDIFAGAGTDSIAVGKWVLSAENRVHRYEAKAGFAVVPDYYQLGTGGTTEAAVSPKTVINLSDRLAEDGTLNWTAPAGNNWRILRLGYSLTGKTNHPAPAEATGLEVDKYDARAVRDYLQNYLAMYRDAVGPELMGRQGINGLLTDSIEVGASNWTAAMVHKFEALRGYDPTPWLPVLTGAVIGSGAESDAFLFDFRRTLAELLATEHYATIAAVAEENGLVLYGEALEDGRPVLGDDLTMRSRASVPMAALWSFNRSGEPRQTLLGDMKGAASVAHIYGQNIVAAESMTSFMSPWAFAPSDLKRLIDLEFVYGVNRPVIHTSVHHPDDDRVPGLSLMVFGQYFNRHDTWATMAKPWIDYIARSSLLLQEGRNYADIAYFYGEEAPISSLFKEKAVGNLPVGYAYDFVNADVLNSQLSVSGGELVASSGASYKLLFLGGTSNYMTLATLQRIGDLVNAGAVVVGKPPQMSPALQDDPQAFNALVDALWGTNAVTSYGKGKVFKTEDSEAVLNALGVGHDFRVVGDSGGVDVLFLHRRLKDGDLYFLTNRENRARTFDASFRVTGKRAEIWRAIDGKVEPVSYRIDGDMTTVSLAMAPEEAYFVVFRQPAIAAEMTLPGVTETTIATLNNAWDIEFQPGRGAPLAITAAELKPLNASDVPGIRYFSGISTYRTEFTLPGGVAKGDTLQLDLGEVGDVAEVFINGHKAGISWFPPFRLEIGEFIREGANSLEVRVANLWVNRLIGDAQPGSEQLTFVASPTYLPDAPLRAAGLIGPVRLLKTQ